MAIPLSRAVSELTFVAIVESAEREVLVVNPDSSLSD